MEDDRIIFEDQDAFGYTYLEDPLLALNFVFPSVKFDKEFEKMRGDEDESDSFSFNYKFLVGSKGLSNTMKYQEKKVGSGDKQITNFEFLGYVVRTLQRRNAIFAKSTEKPKF